jgi:hypothetical protein
VKDSYRSGMRGTPHAILGPDGHPIPARPDLLGQRPELLVPLDWGAPGEGATHAAVALLNHHLRHRIGAHADRVTLSLWTFLKWRLVVCLPDAWHLQPRALDEFAQMCRREQRCNRGDVCPQPCWHLWRASIAERGLLVASRGRILIRTH